MTCKVNSSDSSLTWRVVCLHRYEETCRRWPPDIHNLIFLWFCTKKRQDSIAGIIILGKVLEQGLVSRNALGCMRTPATPCFSKRGLIIISPYFNWDHSSSTQNRTQSTSCKQARNCRTGFFSRAVIHCIFTIPSFSMSHSIIFQIKVPLWS